MATFLVIAGIGLLLLVVSLVAGELLDGVLEGFGGDWLSGAAIAGFLAAFGSAAPWRCLQARGRDSRQGWVWSPGPQPAASPAGSPAASPRTPGTRRPAAVR